MDVIGWDGEYFEHFRKSKGFFSSACFQALTTITEFLNHKYNKAELMNGEHLKLVEAPFGTLFTKKDFFKEMRKTDGKKWASASR